MGITALLGIMVGICEIGCRKHGLGREGVKGITLRLGEMAKVFDVVLGCECVG